MQNRNREILNHAGFTFCADSGFKMWLMMTVSREINFCQSAWLLTQQLIQNYSKIHPTALPCVFFWYWNLPWKLRWWQLHAGLTSGATNEETRLFQQKEWSVICMACILFDRHTDTDTDTDTDTHNTHTHSDQKHAFTEEKSFWQKHHWCELCHKRDEAFEQSNLGKKKNLVCHAVDLIWLCRRCLNIQDMFFQIKR